MTLLATKFTEELFFSQLHRVVKGVGKSRTLVERDSWAPTERVLTIKLVYAMAGSKPPISADFFDAITGIVKLCSHRNFMVSNPSVQETIA